MPQSLIEQHFSGAEILAAADETTHPVFPEETHKPIKPDPDTPYQPTEPATPDVQPDIIGDNQAQ
ncbi:hypothetical protein [Methylophilus sp.]|uniref:hypothetical protein n=1 Tax=Methylophilus sp. TaxID=29541 RepID=UPI0040366650